MDFSSALTLVRQGRVVTRPGWGSLTLGLVAPPAESGLTPFLAVRSNAGQMMPWQPSQQEMLSDDWEEIDLSAGHG